MFLEKVEFDKLGLQVVGVEELDYEQLDAAIEEFPMFRRFNGRN